MMPRLNDEAAGILEARIRDNRFQKKFTLVFMGDTHIGKQCCCNRVDALSMYCSLLSALLQEDAHTHSVLAIIHGGDATHVGFAHLAEFVDKTREVLGYGQGPKSERLPFFLNPGNHEYTGDPGGDSYRSLVGTPGRAQLIWLHPQRVCVALLDTGVGDRGGFEDSGCFQEQLDSIEDALSRHPGYQFILDMHIPPAIGCYRYHVLTLNRGFTEKLSRLVRQNARRITALVTHHRHFTSPSDRPYTHLAGVPVFITAHAGHCDFPRFACLKLNFTYHPYYGWSMKPGVVTLMPKG